MQTLVAARDLELESLSEEHRVVEGQSKEAEESIDLVLADMERGRRSDYSWNLGSIKRILKDHSV
jgi:hypothetical protein